MLNFLRSLSFNDKYGFLIVLITIIVRIFVVSIAWNYGVFVLALKKSFPNSKLFELEWIAGLAQGLGSLIAPAYLVIINKIGTRFSFIIGLTLCSISLFVSSFIENEHFLFLTYSIPFGIGSSLVMFIGTLVTGLYFPSLNKFHMLSTVSISLGFPLGYLILNPLTEYLFEHHEWHYVKRVYSGVALGCVLLFGPFFTDKHISAETTNDENGPLIVDENNRLYPSNKYQIVTNIIWFFGLFSTGLAINAIVINLNGYFESVNIDPVDGAHLLMVYGAADVFYRLLLSISGYYFNNLLVIFYIISALIGVILTLFWFHVTTYGLNYLMTICFALCSAVFMSLQYPISAEINGINRIQSTYTLNVMVSGFGIIIGPTVSGGLLDKFKRNYKVIFELSLSCFIFSLLLFLMVKVLIMYAKTLNRRESIRSTDTIE